MAWVLVMHQHGNVYARQIKLIVYNFYFKFLELLRPKKEKRMTIYLKQCRSQQLVESDGLTEK